jgi:membrane-associated protease RseP (regulator of RpoE activity)
MNPCRAVLVLLLAALLGVFSFAPVGEGFAISQALADDDDGDDDDDDRPRPRRMAPRPSPRQAPRPAPPRPLPEFVVAVPAGADLDRIAALGFRVVARERLALTGREIARLRPLRRLSLAQARRLIAGAVPQAVLDLNTRYRPSNFPCAPEDCPAHAAVGWPAPLAGCRLAPRIGMVDTGIDLRAPALRGAHITLLSTRSEGRPAAGNAHGTVVAALIAGAADGPAPGLLPQAEIIAVDAFHRAGGQEIADAYDVARALDRLAGHGVVIVNLSLAGPENAVLEEAIAAMAARGVVLVAAAGNAGPRAPPQFPAAYRDVIAVTAADAHGRAYRQATGGPHIAFAAPGVKLWTASGKAGRPRSGTSYAAPFVTAGLAALRARMPEALATDLAAVLAKTARDLGEAGRDPVFGWGMVTMPACRP